MMKVTNRTIRSVPQRTSTETWNKIVNILCEHDVTARHELEKVTGIARKIISGRICDESPIIVECVVPQTRIYCLYDDDAILGSDANEGSFNFNPLNGNWKISLPCHKENLKCFSNSLKKKSNRIKLRCLDKKITMFEPTTLNSSQDLNVIEIDAMRFMRS